MRTLADDTPVSDSLRADEDVVLARSTLDGGANARASLELIDVKRLPGVEAQA